jgi:small subunit ribosomal protein S13
MQVYGKEISKKKKAFISLQFIYGVGLVYSSYLCGRVGVSLKSRGVSFTRGRLQTILRLLSLEGIFETELGRCIIEDIKQKITLRCYQGVRHLHCLPVNGQRTKNNRKTARKLAASRLIS